MKAKEIFGYLMDNACERWDETCDVLIAGDENKEISHLGVCFKLTAEVLQKAIDEQVDMIITHEPTFCRGDFKEDANETDLKKWKLLEESGITLYRFHDHAHNTEPDYIHKGFLEALKLPIAKKYERESLGVCRYELAEEISLSSLALKIKEALSLEAVKVVGSSDFSVKSICLGLGSVGLKQIEYLHEPGCDVFITGEVGEVCTCEYIRDAAYFGDKKAVLILGHYGAEYAGMKYLANKLNEVLLPTIYFDCGEVYRIF